MRGSKSGRSARGAWTAGTALALAIAGASASKSYCPSPTPDLCARFFESDSVFLGKILERDSVEGQGPNEVGWLRYEVEVGLVFRGQPKAVEQVLTEDASGRWVAEVDRTYLVFVSAGETFSTCGPLDRPEYADEAERRVRELLEASQATIEGEVVLDEGGTDATKAGAGIALSVSGPGGVRKATTDEDGRFRIGVPPGRYRLRAGNLRPTVYSRQGLDEIDLVRGQCAQFQLTVGPHKDR